MIMSQIIYKVTPLEPPKRFIKQINKLIRSFYFKNTLYKPSLKTAAREETEGGTRLNHVETKIKSLRIKYILEAMEDKNKYPLFEYYNGLRLINIKKLDNNTPHCFRPPEDEH